jgi:large subunit ribosomal protein L36e
MVRFRRIVRKMSKSGISKGLNKGHVTTTRSLKVKPVSKKGVQTKRTKFVKNLIREVVGFAPYEKRILELLKNSKDKKAKKLAKKKLGTFGRGKRKVDELSNVISESRRAAAH